MGVEGDVEFFDAYSRDVSERLDTWHENRMLSSAVLTIEFLEHTLNGAGAATACHGHVELVMVVGHLD